MESQSCVKWYNVFCYYQATGSWDCTVRLWPLGKGKMEVKCLKGHSSNIHAVSFSSSALLVSNGARIRAVPKVRFGAEVHKSNIRVKTWHSEYENG